jgi:asparagine synthetase B (glutamine-hydrolysing)
MCGICGVAQLDGSPRELVPLAMLDGTTDLLTHRGLDNRGTHSPKR